MAYDLRANACRVCRKGKPLHAFSGSCSGAHKTPHLAGVEKAMWVNLVLEAELISIRSLVTAAILDRVDMRVCDIDATLLVQRNDLVEAVGILVAQHLQCGVIPGVFV